MLQLSTTHLEIIIGCVAALLLIYLAHRANIKYRKPIIIFLIIAYGMILLSMTVFPITIPEERMPIEEMLAIKKPWNLKPLSLIIPQYKNMINGQTGAARQFLGNIVLFIPAGLLLPMLGRKLRKFHRVLLIGFLWTLLIETTQLVLHLLCMGWRSFDVDDLILNTLGVIIGYLLYLILFYRKDKAISANQ
ncbi:MAG: VanZ family protein [Proteobacteria bacterium]|nr:VanZ family protein [Pseudomonadota bacterium]